MYRLHIRSISHISIPLRTWTHPSIQILPGRVSYHFHSHPCSIYHQAKQKHRFRSFCQASNLLCKIVHLANDIYLAHAAHHYQTHLRKDFHLATPTFHFLILFLGSTHPRTLFCQARFRYRIRIAYQIPSFLDILHCQSCRKLHIHAFSHLGIVLHTLSHPSERVSLSHYTYHVPNSPHNWTHPHFPACLDHAFFERNSILQYTVPPRISL